MEFILNYARCRKYSILYIIITMKKILFVCMGNICRSPAAEAVMKKLIYNQNLNKEYFIDSAGTINLHKGEKADSRMIFHSSKRGYDITSISRQIENKDYLEFDKIVVMDQQNYNDVINKCPDKKFEDKIINISDFFTKHNDKKVPDPYYGEGKDFEYVLDLLEDACQELLAKLVNHDI